MAANRIKGITIEIFVDIDATANFCAGFYAGFCAVLYCFCAGFYVGTWADLSHGTGCKRNNNLEDITINKLRLSSTV